MNKEKKIIIVSNTSLHKKTGAAFSRIYNYKKALNNSYSFYSLEFDQFHEKHKLTDFKKCNDCTIFFSQVKERKGNFFYRNFLKLFNITRSIRIVQFILKHFNKEETVILLYSVQQVFLFFILLGLKVFYKYKVVVEKNELETAIQLNIVIPRKLSLILFLAIYPIRLLFGIIIDASAFFGTSIIVISTKLHKLYRLHPKTIRIPILTNCEDFDNRISSYRNISFPIRFIYMGTLTERKDAIFEVLEAVNLAKYRIKGKAEFHFIGDGNNTVLSKLQKYIENNSLTDIIKILQPVQHYEVMNILKVYDIGLLIRSSNLQTEYGFSTKLGEYMAAGLPVLTNEISDNLLFLTDKIDSFIIKDNNVDEIQKKIIEIIEMRTTLLNMKIAANKTAKMYFDAKIYSTQLQNIFS